jgi:hypothetical protein
MLKESITRGNKSCRKEIKNFVKKYLQYPRRTFLGFRQLNEINKD